MNRKQWRQQGQAIVKDPVYNLKASEIKAIKEETARKATDTAFFLMLAIPVMIIHDKYPLLMKKTVDGKSREERFADLCIDLYDTFDKGYLTLDELAECLWEEAGIKLDNRKEN